MNAAADQSFMTSSAVQTMENNARKSQELDATMETQGLQPSQLSSSNSITVSQEAERSSVHVYRLNKQSQPQWWCQIPHQITGPNHLGGATQGFIGMPKLEQQNSLNDPKRLPGGSVALLNNPASQQTSNAWQPPSNKDQNSGFLSSGSYVKKEPSEIPTEQQHRQNISKIHGLLSTRMAPTTSTGLTSLNSASLSRMTQLDPIVSLSTHVPSNTSGNTVRAPVKKPSVGQKKLEALGSSPPAPLSVWRKECVEVDGNAGADGDKDMDEGCNKSLKVNKEEDDKMRTNAVNIAARATVGGDDMLSKWQLMAGHIIWFSTS
ncbi:Transcription initiation factor TFIID subunit 4b [Arachis hypogaea]|nr:Transcription initiation factor TFIID subunit 4b [Arachis hypogaea]